jgi:thioredoxin-dependent peroxiredoxin
VITVGEAAPDFTLAGTGGRRYTLAEHRGEPVVLAFYPADGSPVCSIQLPDYSLDIDAFRDLCATLLAISPQDVDSHEDFARRLGIAFPLLADTDQAVGRAYGIVGPLGFYRRAVVVVDSGGTVRHARRTLGYAYPSSESVLRATREALVPA